MLLSDIFVYQHTVM